MLLCWTTLNSNSGLKRKYINVLLNLPEQTHVTLFHLEVDVHQIQVLEIAGPCNTKEEMNFQTEALKISVLLIFIRLNFMAFHYR